MAKSLLLITIFFSLAACSSNVPEPNSAKPSTSNVENSTSDSKVMAKPDPLYDYMNQDSATTNNEKYCAELSKKIQELKGKPQRRYAAQQRYDLECKR